MARGAACIYRAFTERAPGFGKFLPRERGEIGVGLPVVGEEIQANLGRGAALAEADAEHIFGGEALELRKVIFVGLSHEREAIPVCGGQEETQFVNALRTSRLQLATLSLLDGNFDSGVDQNSEEIGRVAVRTLAGLIHQNERGIPRYCRRILVEGRWRDGTNLPPHVQPKSVIARSHGPAGATKQSSWIATARSAHLAMTGVGRDEHHT